jgi:hypothetical protein
MQDSVQEMRSDELSTHFSRHSSFQYILFRIVCAVTSAKTVEAAYKLRWMVADSIIDV